MDFFIRSLSAILSFLVRLSCYFCLYLSVSSISILTLCRKVSRVPLSDSLSGLKVYLHVYLGVMGSLGSVFCFRGLVVVCTSYIVFSLCIKFLISVCRVCIGNCLGLGMNFRTSFCVSVRVVCLAKSLSILGLVCTVLGCEIISWSQVCIACMSLFYICLFFCI